MSQPSAKDQSETDARGNTQKLVEGVRQEVKRSKEPRYRVFKKGRVLSLLYFIQFILFTMLAWFVSVNPVLPIDVAITRELQEHREPWLVWFMVAISYEGYHWWFSGGLVVLAALICWGVRLRLEAVVIVVLSAVSYLLNNLIKLIVSRPRPSASLVDVIQGASGLSFPSGHVMSYIAFWGLIFSLGIILFKRDRWWQYLLLLLSGAMVVLIGPSRIYLGDHWASDVLGGYLFGGLLLGMSLGVYLWLKGRGVLAVGG